MLSASSPSQILTFQRRPRLPSQNMYVSARIKTLMPLPVRMHSSTPNPMDRAEQDPVPIADTPVPFNYTTSRDDFAERNVEEVMRKIEIIPSMPHQYGKSFAAILQKKLEVCEFLCNFIHESVEESIKAAKKTYLEEILAMFQNTLIYHHITSNDVSLILQMVIKNITRKLPKNENIFVCSDDLSPIPDPSWPHLSLVYQILNRVHNGYSKHKGFNLEFLYQVFQSLKSPDINERDNITKFAINYMKTHPKDKNIVLVYISKILQRDESPYVIGPILTMMSDIFTSAPTMYPEFAQTFHKILLPLLKYTKICAFERQLTVILDYFIDEGCSYSQAIVNAIIRYWPRVQIEKEIIFVKILTKTMPRVSKKELPNMIKRIFSIYADCSCSYSNKVAEAAFQLWTTLEIEPILQEHSKLIVPIILPAIFNTMREHWSKNIRENAAIAFKLMSRVAPRMVEQCTANQINNSSEDLKKWASIARVAAREDPELNLGAKLSEISFLYNNVGIRSMKKISSGFSQPNLMTVLNPFANRPISNRGALGSQHGLPSIIKPKIPLP